MLHSNTRQVVRTPKQQRNKKDTTYMQILLLLLLLLPFSASSCPAGTWHFRLRLCPHAPSLLLTHTAHSKNTGAGENEPTTSQVPSYDVRTRTHLAGGRRPASAATSALHSRRRRLDPPDKARDLVVNERHPHPGRPLRRANEGHQPPSCGAVFERGRPPARALRCHRALLLKHCLRA